MKVYSGGDGIVWAVARIGPDRDQIAALTSQAVFIWNEDSITPVQTLAAENEGRAHSELFLSSDGRWLATYGEDRLFIWRFGKSGWETRGQDSPPGLCAVRFATGPDALIVVRLVDGESGRVEFQLVRRSLTGREKSLKCSIFAEFPAAPSSIESASVLYDLHWWAADLSSDCRWLLLSAREKWAHVWDLSAGKPVGSVKLRGLPNKAAFSPDGTLVAIDCGTTVYIHRTATLDLVHGWRVKHCYVPELGWSPDGHWLARADLSSTVRLFDVSMGREAAALGVRGHRGSAVAFATDGLTYLVGTFKGSVVVWDLDL